MLASWLRAQEVIGLSSPACEISGRARFSAPYRRAACASSARHAAGEAATSAAARSRLLARSKE
jgi:hypothetical protein